MPTEPIKLSAAEQALLAFLTAMAARKPEATETPGPRIAAPAPARNEAGLPAEGMQQRLP